MEGVTSYYCAYLPPANSKQIMLVSSHSINYGLYLQLGQKYMRNTSIQMGTVLNTYIQSD